MRFLVDADLPRRTGELLGQYGHQGKDVRDIGLGSVRDEMVAACAQHEGLCLITADFGFADVRNYPPDQYSGIVVLELPRNATAEMKLGLVRRLLQRPELVERLPGRLAVVGFRGVRLRPA